MFGKGVAQVPFLALSGVCSVRGLVFVTTGHVTDLALQTSIFVLCCTTSIQPISKLLNLTLYKQYMSLEIDLKPVLKDLKQ